MWRRFCISVAQIAAAAGCAVPGDTDLHVSYQKHESQDGAYRFTVRGTLHVPRGDGSFRDRTLVLLHHIAEERLGQDGLCKGGVEGPAMYALNEYNRFDRAFTVRCKAATSQTPNHSIERTASGALRAPAASAHLRR